MTECVVGSSINRFGQDMVIDRPSIRNSASSRDFEDNSSLCQSLADVQNEASELRNDDSSATTPSFSGENSASKSLEVTSLNFARAISLTSLFHPTHDDGVIPPDNEEELLGQGFLLGLASAQQKLEKASEGLGLTIDQIQTLQVNLYSGESV